MTAEEDYTYVSELQAEFNALCRDKRRWIIVEEPDGKYSVTDLMKDGIGPCILKPGKREAAARLLQLMALGPVAPQDWPEEICVGEIEYKSADILPLTRPSVQEGK